MKRLRKMYLLAASVFICGCASNEELFAEYDAYCQGLSCESTAPEVIYERVEIEVQVAAETMPWEPAIYFAYDSDSLDTNEALRLDRNMEVLNSDISLKISLQAFTDSVASYSYNSALAERRRLAVVEYLTEAGIAEDRIVSSSGSELLPVLPTDSVEDRIINRRVEMMLLDATGRPVSFGITLPEVEVEFVPPQPIEKVF